MKSKMRLLSAIALVSALALAGCLVSGVVVIDEMFYDIRLSTDNLFYSQDIDLTGLSDWEDIEEHLERIEAMGFELWITNNTGSEATLNVWLDNLDDPEQTDIAGVEANATVVLEDLTLSDGANYFSYAETLSHITNIETLRALALSGRFWYYGHSTAGVPGDDYVIDSIRVVVAVSGGTT